MPYKGGQNFLDLTGKRFGMLIVLRRVTNLGARVRWLCKCDCGTEHAVLSTHLVSGKISSCLCRKRENTRLRKTTHGFSKEYEFKIWKAMHRRCGIRSDVFVYYGGRGIAVDNAWNSYEQFLQDMGRCPPGLELDRIDNNKGYSKDNCRWATHRQNALNRRITKLYDFNGEKLTLSEWAERYGFTLPLLHARVCTRGWPLSKALLTPLQTKFHHKSHIPRLAA